MQLWYVFQILLSGKTNNVVKYGLKAPIVNITIKR